MSRKNPRLKSAHTVDELTPEQILEYKKCINDPVYFMCNYVYIKHPMHGQILFGMYGYQKDLVKLYTENRYSIVLSARQTGKTETTCAYLLWFAIFHFDKMIVVASNKSSNAMEIIGKIRYAYEELPIWLKPGINEDSWNKHELAFENKSRIVSQTTSSDTGRGLAISLLYCDELAFVKNHLQFEFWSSILPTLSTGGACIISSTPNGSVDLFSKLWHQQLTGKGEFAGIYVPWDAPPNRDEKFKQNKIDTLGLRKWKQEYECIFLSSDGTLIDSEFIKEYEKRLDDVRIEFEKDGVPFWKQIHAEKTYIIGCDPATGDGEDSSVIHVFEFPSMEQVMEFRDDTISSNFLYQKLKTVVNFFFCYAGEVYWSFEKNGIGEGLVALYENDEFPPEGTLVSEPMKSRVGLTTSNASKIKACFKFKDMLESGQITINSAVFIREIMSYTRQGQTYKAQTGATDDCVAAFIVILRILEEMAEYDDNVYMKLYGFQDEKKWEPDENDIDENPLPFYL